jgi:CHAD domain-containing protein
LSKAARSWPVKRALWESDREIPPVPWPCPSTGPRAEFRAEENVSDGLVRIANTLIHGALSRIERPGSNRAEDLHRVRLAVKRLRALLRLARPAISETFYQRENGRLKTVADRLSHFRDITVSRQTLAKLAKDAPDQRSGKAFRELSARMVDAGPDRVQFQHDRELALRRAVESLAEAGQNFENMLVIGEGWQALGSGLQRIYRRARAGMLRAQACETADTFHHWRKQVKYFYYQLQMLKPIWPKRLGTIVRRLNKLEDKLGMDHDLAVLESVLRQSPEHYGGKRAVKQVAACLERQSKKLRKETECLSREVFRDKPAKFVAKVEKRWTAWQHSHDKLPPQNQ